MKKISVVLMSLALTFSTVNSVDAFINTSNKNNGINFLVQSGFNEYSSDENSLVSLGEFIKVLLVTSDWKPTTEVNTSFRFEDVPVSDIAYIERARQLGLVHYNPENPIVGYSSPISISRALELSLRYYGFSNPRFLNNPEEFKKNVTNYNSNFVLAPLIERGLMLGLLESKNSQVNFFATIKRSELASLLINIRDIQSQILKGEFKPSPGFVIENSSTGNQTSPISNNEQLLIFQDVFERIRTEYLYRDSVNTIQLIYNAISGMVDSLGDSNSAFLEPIIQEAFRDNLSNQIEGIGASLSLDDQKRVVVVSPLVDSPAQKAGIRSGDIITHVDGTSIQGLNLNQVVSRIQGNAGTTVRLDINRNGQSLSFVITRSAVTAQAVSGEITANNIGIIKLRNFGLGVETSFASYVRQMKEANVSGVILDLRSNPGGYLDSATRLAGHFIRTGEVVSKINYAGNRYEGNKTFGAAELLGKPVVVLVNKGTASASEILAAALRDKAGATIIGEQTFGKGTVQELITYTDNSALKLTVAKWLTSNNVDVNKVGLTPAIRVSQTEADTRLGNDSVLNRAIQELTRR